MNKKNKLQGHAKFKILFHPGVGAQQRRRRFEKKAKTTFLEEVQKDTPNVVNTLIDLMCKCIEEVHEYGSFEINKPIVYKSLDRGRIKKVNIN